RASVRVPAPWGEARCIMALHSAAAHAHTTTAATEGASDATTDAADAGVTLRPAAHTMTDAASMGLAARGVGLAAESSDRFMCLALDEVRSLLRPNATRELAGHPSSQ